MIIGIEASRANRLQKTGVEWYAYRVIQELKKLPEADRHSWLLYSNLPLAMGLERGPTNWHERRLSWPPKYMWTQIRLSWEMAKRPPEILFVPAHVLPRFIPKRTVVTVHDIGFHRMPSLYKPQQVAYHEATTRDIVKRASRIITVSQFSRRELIEGYNADPARITVTHLGVDHERYRPADPAVIAAVLGRYRLAQPYLIYVGRLELKKNILTALEAFRRYKEARGVGDPMKLVFAGIPGMGFDAFQRAYHASGLGESVVFTGYVSEDEKIALLSGATALVHPSWYEGFGLTPLEAMACGCPVVCSSAASLPEVVGQENALWFEPQDVDALAQRLMEITDDRERRQTLIERGLAWVAQYDWAETARRTLPVLSEW